MRAIILAAGSGTRMGGYGESKPKGMLSFGGKTLIERQLERMRSIGLNDIAIITGYKAEMIDYEGVTYLHNPDYASTNMVETLMCAKELFNTEILISYADILYTKELLSMVAGCEREVGVAVDNEWREFWMLRYGSTEEDLESLSLCEDGRIAELGKTISSSEGLDYRYIGLIKFSSKGIDNAVKFYNEKKSKNESWVQSGQPFNKGYMTDLLHELIEADRAVYPVISHGGWLEFDTALDYEKICSLFENGKLSAEIFS
jgi:choline kinase